MIADLLQLSGPSLVPLPASGSTLAQSLNAPYASALDGLLATRNGFTAFDGALLVRPISNPKAPTGVQEWNDFALWQRYYDDEPQPGVFFAADLLGVQFVLAENSVSSFDPETGERTWIAGSLEDWAAWIFADPDQAVGYSLCRKWNSSRSSLQPYERLMAQLPFVLGGQFEFKNFKAVDELFQMKALGPIARRLRGVPDGSEITIKVEEGGKAE